jgi:hypothetical protein
MKLIHNALAPLASLRVQDKYIVRGTKDEYLLPNELLNTAFNVLFEQKGVKFEESETLGKLKQAIRACEIPEGMSGSDIVLGYKPWIKIREMSKKYLVENGFDLQSWETNEL